MGVPLFRHFWQVVSLPYRLRTMASFHIFLCIFRIQSSFPKRMSPMQLTTLMCCENMYVLGVPLLQLRSVRVCYKGLHAATGVELFHKRFAWPWSWQPLFHFLPCDYWENSVFPFDPSDFVEAWFQSWPCSVDWSTGMLRCLPPTVQLTFSLWVLCVASHAWLGSSFICGVGSLRPASVVQLNPR